MGIVPSFDYLSDRFDKPKSIEHASKYHLGRVMGIPVNPGDKLPNGAVLLDERVIRTYEFRRDSIVLCVGGGVQPFVSWVRTIHTDASLATGGYRIADYCDSGHYHSSLTEAIGEFLDRVAKKLELLDA